MPLMMVVMRPETQRPRRLDIRQQIIDEKRPPRLQPMRADGVVVNLRARLRRPHRIAVSPRRKPRENRIPPEDIIAVDVARIAQQIEWKRPCSRSTSASIGAFGSKISSHAAMNPASEPR